MDMLNHGGIKSQARECIYSPILEHKLISLGKRKRQATEANKKHTEGERDAFIQQNCVWCKTVHKKYIRTSFRCSCDPMAFFCNIRMVLARTTVNALAWTSSMASQRRAKSMGNDANLMIYLPCMCPMDIPST